MRIFSYVYDSPMGSLYLCADDSRLHGIWSDKAEAAEYIDVVTEKGDDIMTVGRDDCPDVIEQTAAWLDKYFDGKIPDCMPQLQLHGSKFRQTVSQIMLEIPYGELTTYGDIAKAVAHRLGKERMSAQAVGGAVGSNEFSILVPCHRVVGKDGNLTGYAGGMDRKIYLLKHEGVDFEEHHLYVR
ncbi:methylated-DNA--[protein]-cysteine S-methyltransferase [Mogibacterium timidum]|uniref:methylated-DNA--[protein]-cysteine S-methyltransferase n=1 Tax=Mogibacterium timidum TaxID=35519 RepID=UPI002352F7DF|nr:methylated-DNA--[protein]-cysteine S-methyltransferase [Mogibacterium timidum]